MKLDLGMHIVMHLVLFGKTGVTCQLYDGSNRPDSDSLQRLQSWGRSSDSASTSSAPPVAEPSATSRRLQSLLIWGGGAPDVHVFLFAGGATV
jgi:hypothetical protein